MFKNFIYFTLKCILCVLLCVFIGFTLLTAVFSLDTKNMEKNLIESVDVFREEGSYPKIYTLTGQRSQDNFTDSIMLSTAAYEGDETLLNRTLSVYRIELTKKSPVDSLVGYYGSNETGQKTAYSRYWHGYLVFLKPMLMFFTYNQIRMINTVFVILITSLVIFLLYKKEFKKFILPYVLSVLLISPTSIGWSLQYSSVFHIFSVSMAVVLFFDNIRHSKTAMISLFTVIGCATCYFDFLTYPLATLGMPLVIYICDSEYHNSEDKAKNILLFSICWVIGYSGMWISKWLLTDIFTDENIFDNVVNQIRLRLSHQSSNKKITLIVTELKNIYCFITNLVLPLPVFYSIYKIKKIINLKCNYSVFRETVPFLMIFIMPFLWYALLCNHSYIHCSFTHKALIVSSFSAMCMLEYLHNYKQPKN